jgi:hypothetical protein
MTLRRVLFIIAAVIFVFAWLVAIGTVTSDSDLLLWQGLIALGLAFGFAGHAA